MDSNYSRFLKSVAEDLRHLAGRAPDIARELRRFANDLDQLSAKASRRDGGSSDEAAA
jgi:hypothetical protein